MENPRKINIRDLKRFLMYYNPTDDLLRQILIGHLLIEEVLDAYIVEFTPNPEPMKKLLKDKNFTFIHKIHVANSLTENQFQYLDPMWKAIKMLNGLRNKVSHQVDYSGYEDTINSIIETLRKGFPESFKDMESQGVKNSLATAIAVIYTDIKQLWKHKRTHEPPYTISELN